MNKQEVIKYIESVVLDGEYYPGNTDYGLKKESIKVETVEDVGGEGQGETRYVVEEITTPTERFFVEIEGYYMSYDGSTWERAFEVTPRQKEITVYDKVK